MGTDPKILDFSLVLASTVHDMKNSIAMLLGSIDDATLQCSLNECQNQQKLLLIQHEGQRLSRHLIQLLTLYRLDTSQYFLNVTENYLVDFFDEVSLENESLLTARGIELEVACDEDICSYFDKELLWGVVNTIINNAYRYANSRIRLSATFNEKYLQMTVEDDGPGYPPHLLRSFGTEMSEVSFSSGGTGLGLYFAHRVASVHQSEGRKGYTEISNTGINNGGKFVIYLP